MTTSSDPAFLYDPDVSYRLGRTLAEWLERNAMSQAEFARRASLSNKHVSQVINGPAGLSAEVAVAFENVTGIPARFWTQLESNHRAYEARTEEAISLAQHVGLLDRFPMKQLAARDLITGSGNPVERLRELLRFFGVANVDALKEVWLAPTALRASKAYEPNTPSLAAWLRIAELEAANISTETFDAQRCEDALDDFRALTQLGGIEWVERLEQRCAEVGIGLVIVKELPRCRINGATRWLSSDKAMIALSLRHRRHDTLWFTFFHELGHLLRHSKRQTFIDAEGAGIAEDLELDADRFASRLLIPPEYQAELHELSTPDDVVEFAARIGVGPSIVVGRMQHERLIPYSQWNQLIPKYSFHDDR